MNMAEREVEGKKEQKRKSKERKVSKIKYDKVNERRQKM